MLDDCFGFTLIELMLALAISAIIVVLGYPAYTHYQTHAQRSRAQVALMQLAAELELYFNENATYAGATLETLGATTLTQGIPYQLQINEAADRHFLIAAVPKQVDAACGALTLTDTNQRGVSGEGDVNACWT